VKIVTEDIIDYLAIKKNLEDKKIHSYIFHPKPLKPIKAVIRHLPGNTAAEDIAKELQELGFDVISVRQLTSRKPQAPSNLPLFLVSLPRNDRSQETFQLSSLSHVIIKVEAYRAQTGITQCYYCQQFGHIWANCKQPPKCVWCGGGHLHKECREKENVDSKPTCCNCKLEDGEKPHCSNYGGCKTAKEELQKKKAQKPQAKETTGRVFTTRLVSSTVSYAEALKGKESGQPRLMQQQQYQPAPGGGEREQESSVKEGNQSGQPSGNKKSTMDNMFKVINVVQQIMTGLNESVSEEGKITAITKIVLKLLNEQ
jgi:hypothetical protein